MGVRTALKSVGRGYKRVNQSINQAIGKKTKQQILRGAGTVGLGALTLAVPEAALGVAAVKAGSKAISYYKKYKRSQKRA